MFNGYRLTVKHPSGIKVEMPLKSLAEYGRSVVAWQRFRWKAKKTAEALQRANRLSMEALVEYSKITSPYATLGIDLQESSRPESRPGENRSPEAAPGNMGK